MPTQASVACPSCGMANPGWRKTCDRCGNSLGTSEGRTVQRSGRPGCVTFYALMLGVASLLLTLGAVLAVAAAMEMESQSPEGPAMLLLALVAAIAFALFILLLATGLWRMKRWARIVVLWLNGLEIFATVILFAFKAVVDGVDVSAPSMLEALGGLAGGILVPGIIFAWFAKNGDRFR